MDLPKDLAIEARKRGIPAMTFMSGNYHRVKGSYSDLKDWFRLNTDIFIQTTFEQKQYNCTAIERTTGKTLFSDSDYLYHKAEESILRKLVVPMKIKKSIKV